MKKFITLLFLALITSNISMARELGEDLSADCSSTYQSSRHQETLSDATASDDGQTFESSSR